MKRITGSITGSFHASPSELPKSSHVTVTQAQEKLSPLLKLKYHNALADAVADLGSVEQIRDAFTGFQKFLYEAAG